MQICILKSECVSKRKTAFFYCIERGKMSIIRMRQRLVLAPPLASLPFQSVCLTVEADISETSYASCENVFSL